MSTEPEIRAALDEAVRALRDVAELDPSRPCTTQYDKVARKALERISHLLEVRVDAPGHTILPGERRDYPPLRDGAYDV